MIFTVFRDINISRMIDFKLPKEHYLAHKFLKMQHSDLITS